MSLIRSTRVTVHPLSPRKTPPSAEQDRPGVWPRRASTLTEGERTEEVTGGSPVLRTPAQVVRGKGEGLWRGVQVTRRGPGIKGRAQMCRVPGVPCPRQRGGASLAAASWAEPEWRTVGFDPASAPPGAQGQGSAAGRGCILGSRTLRAAEVAGAVWGVNLRFREATREVQAGQ